MHFSNFKVCISGWESFLLMENDDHWKQKNNDNYFIKKLKQEAELDFFTNSVAGNSDDEVVNQNSNGGHTNKHHHHSQKYSRTEESQQNSKVTSSHSEFSQTQKNLKHHKESVGSAANSDKDSFWDNVGQQQAVPHRVKGRKNWFWFFFAWMINY